ncbi:hypothetical protein CAEBREN_14275 [Caenorhabditis brenneri]|uniref:Amino acid transporter transmembrane domain-containing protein n=1 Tax=Caenorhabditis brenneri TaxID=135651 RepID=G0PDB4_CAEBE|nr:hypothetical protein CAEBREN_14275 [Caenorhabditis brenneri]
MENGYSWYIAVIFTFGETAGSGLVALPNAMLALGPIVGIITLVVMCLIPFYTATLLGNNWIIMKTSPRILRDVPLDLSLGLLNFLLGAPAHSVLFFELV